MFPHFKAIFTSLWPGGSWTLHQAAHKDMYLGTRTIGVGETNNPFILSGLYRNLVCGRGIKASIILAWAATEHWDTGPNKAEIARMNAGRKVSRLEALCSHIVLTLHPNTSYSVQQWLDTLHWNIIINPHYWAHWNHSCASEQLRVSVGWKT